MALAGVKFDDGRGGFVSNCFPVRSAFGTTSNDANGAWLIAHHAEQRRRFKAVLCTKPRTYARIKEERKKSEIEGTRLDESKFEDDGEDRDELDDEGKILDGFFLMKHCCVDDPSDLCSVNIAGKELVDVKEEDIMLFENVAYMNAGENYLPFEAFRGFPALKELEIPLNGLRNLKLEHTDFTNLEMLDLSYNNLSQDDLLTLGLLTHLKVLHLTGNSFKHLPQDLAMPYLSREKQVRLQRFKCLEVLLLDDNKLMDMTVFAALAGLPKLRHLNLSKNEIFFVPQLKSVEGRVVTQDGKHKKRTGKPGSGRKSSRRAKSQTLESQQTTLIEDLEVMPRTDQEGENSDFNSRPKASLPSEITGSTDTDILRQDSERASKTGTQVTDAELQALLAEDFSTASLNARIDELEIETDDVTQVSEFQDNTASKLAPFPELRYLNLSCNMICEEEALLALAAWPMLLELDIHKNPLTLEKSGDPPLLRRFLQDRLGIKINRKEPENDTTGHVKKSKVEIRPKNRKVTELVPKVPRLTLEEKMMLELPAPPPVKAVEHGSSPILKVSKKANHVLPPIPTTPKEELTEAWAERIMEEEDEEDYYNEEENEERKYAAMDRENSGTFFMTQVDDAGMKETPSKKELSFADERYKPGTKELPGEKKKKMKKVGAEVSDRYKGYELLLDIEELEDEPDLPPAHDIQGNVRALKHTLNHQLVYRDPAVELNKVKKMVQEYRRAPVPPSKPCRTYQAKVDDMLTNLKTRSIVDEEKLTSVLKDKAKYVKRFPEADALLGQIQHRYNAVRVHSLKDAREARKITENVKTLFPPTETRAK